MQGNRPLADTATFQYLVSRSPQTHLSHLYHQQQEQQFPHLQNNLPETSVQNPFQITPFNIQTLESGIARLSLSPYNRQGFDDGGVVNGSIHGSNHINDYMIGGQRFLPSSLQDMEHVYTDQLLQSINLQRNSDMSAKVEPIGSGRMMVGSNIDGWFLRDSRREDFGKDLSSISSNGFFGGCTGDFRGGAPKSQNNKRPQWLQDDFNCLRLEDFRGTIVSFAKDQYGCSFLQKIIDENSMEEIEMIFSEVIDHVCNLMIDPFGNYVIQKLVEKCSDEQRTQILLMVTRIDFQLIRICLDSHGTRAVQKLLKHLNTPQQISMVVSALRPGAVALTKNMNGHHVVQYCLEHFPVEDSNYLLNDVANNCYGIATDQCGCCVLQHCVEFSRGELRECLVAEITANALLLSEDCYGNYVVQYILGLRIPHITANLLRQLEGSYTSLSRNKYGSHVVEKCLIESEEPQSARIIMELLRSPDVSMLLMDPYGNYVMQLALSVSKGFVHRALLNQVQINSPMMRSNKYGKKVLAWFNGRN